MALSLYLTAHALIEECNARDFLQFKVSLDLPDLTFYLGPCVSHVIVASWQVCFYRMKYAITVF